MQKAQDFTKVMQDMTANLPFDSKALQETFKSSAAFGEKMTKVALEAAEKSSEISSKWTKDTIAKVGTLAKVKEEPTDYSKALSDFASAAAEMLAAGKDMSEDATAAVKKAQEDVTSAAKKAAASVK